MHLVDSTKQKMAAAIEHLKTELAGVRTGRANVALLDSVFVDAFGSSMKLKSVANISVSDNKTLLLTPFDPTQAGTIAKAIEKANLGVQVVVDGHLIRVKVPQMDNKVRQEMAKLCKRKAEEAKVSVRNIRRDSNEAAKKLKASGELTEDQQKQIEKQIQKLTDEFCETVESLCAKKEEEVLAI